MPVPVNEAVTVWFAAATAQTLVVLEQPVQPENVEFAPAVAVRVTTVPAGTVVEHEEPQLMPAPVTVPVPVPDRATVRVAFCEAPPNVAVTDLTPFISTVQVAPDVELHPVQLVNEEPVAGVAVRVTICTGFALTTVEQVVPQLIPPTLEVTVPEPEPVLVTVSV